MANATDPLEPGFVRMIHPDTQGIADVAEGAVGVHAAAGWALLTPENTPEPAAEPPPPQMTEAQAREAAAKEATPKTRPGRASGTKE